MKIIKFDLPINGTKVKTLQELRDNLTDEILTLARSSQVERWLRTRQLPEQAQAVAEAVQQKGSDDKGLFLALCKVLEVEVHPDDVNAIFDEPPVPGRFLQGSRHANEKFLNLFNENIDCKTVSFTLEMPKFVHHSTGSLIARNCVKKWDKVKVGDLILCVSSSAGKPLFECVSPVSGLVRKTFFDIDNCHQMGEFIEPGDFVISIAQISA